jgi:hypothetical protein
MRPNRTVLLALAFVATALLACKSDKGRAVALEMDGQTVIYEEKCGSKDYVSCGQRVRDRAKDVLCSRNGKGNHPYLYKISKGDPIKNTAICR